MVLPPQGYRSDPAAHFMLLIAFFVLFPAPLTSLTWRPLKILTSLARTDMSPILRPISMPLLRSFPRVLTASFCSSHGSSSNHDDLNEVKKEIRAVKHTLKGGDSTKASEDILDFLPIYKGRNEDFLTSMLEKLQDEKVALISQAPVEIKGTLRVE